MATITKNNVYVVATNVLSPLGLDTNENFQNIHNLKTGLRIKPVGRLQGEFCVSQMNDSWIDTLFKKYGDSAQFSKLEKMSIISIANALSQTNIDASSPDTLFIYCTTKGNITLLDTDTQDTSTTSLLLGDLAKKIATYFSFKNQPIVVSNACISGTQGIVVAHRLIRAGIYKNIIITGGDLVSDFTLAGFKAFNALSDAPCQPFDNNRQGVNLGEAAATMILSSENNEKQPIAVIEGYISNDANHISAPSRTGDGLYSILSKITQKFSLESIDFISAHGTATRYNDDMESQAFYRAGLSEIPTHSLKGYFGHTLGAAGLLESVLGVESLLQNQSIASKGYQEPGTPYKMNVLQCSEKKTLNRFIKTSSGFGGCNAAVMFSKTQ